jgi:hypothetical protein
MLISSVSSFSHQITTTKIGKKIEKRMRIEEDIRKELEAVKVSIVFINPLLGALICDLDNAVLMKIVRRRSTCKT